MSNLDKALAEVIALRQRGLALPLTYGEVVSKTRIIANTYGVDEDLLSSKAYAIELELDPSDMDDLADAMSKRRASSN